MRTLADALSDSSFQSWLTDVIDRIAIAEDVSEFQRLLDDATRRLGAERSLFSSVAGDPPYQSHAFVLGGDPGWWHCRRATIAPRDDPWLVCDVQGSMSARSATAPTDAALQSDVMEAEAVSGFASSLRIHAHSGQHESRASLLCLGHSSHGYFEGPARSSLVARARGLAVELHHWWRRQDQKRLAASVRLSASELELLAHHHAGLRSKQIARTMGISLEAVDSRFRRIVVKLGVRNRRAAVRIALDGGLLSMQPAGFSANFVLDLLSGENKRHDGVRRCSAPKMQLG